MKKPAFRELLLIFYSLFFLSLHFASAQQAGKQVPIKVPTTMSSPNALLYLPWDYNISNKKYPLICFFHGMGEAGNGGSDLSKLGNQGLPGVINGVNDQGTPHPPYAVNKATGDTTWFIVLSIQATWFSPSPSTMIAGISSLINDYHIRIDTNRVYSSGLSAGGEESLFALDNYINGAPLYYPSTTFAAGVVMSPAAGVYASVVNNFKNKYVWFFQGTEDHTVSPQNAYGSYDTINAHFPGHARLTKYPEGHCCWMQFYEPTYKELIGSDSMSIYDWLLQYSLSSENDVSVPNQPPVAKVGSNQTITLPIDSVMLDGSASSDPDGTIVSYNWTKKSGPSAFTIDSAASPKTEVSGLDTGTYVFTLTVKDDSGSNSSADVTVFVNDSIVSKPANQPPIANAGSNQTITLPVDSVLLDGSASTDSDGTIVSYNWTKKSGPSAFTIDSAESPKTEVSGLDTGSYVFTLTVTDDSGSTSSADVTVFVNDSIASKPANQPPIANAGSNQTITLPVDPVMLDGSASSDPDGTIVSYTWTKKSGPSAFTIDSAESPKTEVSGLDTGAYVFTLTVKDDSGSTSSADVTVFVNDSIVSKPANQPPIANAGSNQTITLPVDSVMLDGSASTDSDGTIVSYNWTKKSGPSAFTIDSAESPKTEVSGLDTGTYIFMLTVTDDSGSIASAEVTIEVTNSAVLGNVNNPIADAGPDQMTTMPLNAVTVNGSGTISKNASGGYIFYHWEKISGPDQYFIQFPYKPITQIQNLVVGVYTFKLTVHINSGPEASDTVQVIVKPDAVQPGDVSYNANNYVLPYTQLFQYGSNTGAYSNGWNDTSVARIALNAGVHTIRLPLPEYFIERYNYDIRLSEFSYYSHQLGMKENTLFVGDPGPGAVDSTTFPPNTRISNVFKNLYAPIWDNGENGTPVNDSNYFASYIYNLAKRYGKNVRFWEIVNEPDMTGFSDNGNASRPDSWWNVPPQVDALLNLRAPIFYYIRMLRIAYEVIKKIDPDDYVAPGGIGYPAFLDALLRYTDNPDGGKVTPAYPYTGGAYFDVLSFHDYPAYSLRYWNNDIGGFSYLRYSDQAADAVINLKNILDSVLISRGYNGQQYPKKPFILTETNVTQKSFTNGDGSQYFGSNDFQRNYVVKILVKAQQNGIRQLYLFGIGDGADYNNATSPYQLMGIYGNLGTQSRGHQKLTDEGKAYKTTSMLLYGWRFDSTRTAALNLPDSIDGAAFRKDTQYRYVLWAKTHIDLSEAASATYTFPSNLNIDSLYTYQWNYSVDTAAQGKTGAQNVVLTGSPIFLMAAPFVDSANVPPVADAGNNLTIMLPKDSVTLDGSGSVDPDGAIVSYQWTQTAGPNTASIDSSNPVHPIITGLVAGVYTFRLTVTDNHGTSDSDSVTVTINNRTNQFPVPNAGANQVITLPVNSVNLNGSASTDPDGTIVKYLWTKQTGPVSVAFSDSTGATTTASDLTPGTYVFTLTVTDNDGAKASSQVTVFVNVKPNKPPVAHAGSNITIQLPVDSVLLDGSKSTDPDGTIAGYEWNEKSGPVSAVFGQPDGPQVEVNNLLAGTYVFSLTVTDNQGAQGTSTVTVVVKPAKNIPPVADAGNDNTVTLPVDVISLNGSASFDPDGRIVAYQWSKSSGPSSYHFDNAETANTKVSGLSAGTYIFTLTVTDNKGATNSDEVIIVVQLAPNQPPVADAGKNQTIALPLNSVTLDGSASHDSDGSLVAWKWTEQSGPTTAILSNNSNAKTTASGLIAGTYVFTLTVKDNDNATGSSDVKIIVNKKDTTGTTPVTPPANLPPVVNAGSNQTITLPVDSVILDGSASNDSDGKIVSWKWVKTSGPASFNIKNSSGTKTAVSGLANGTYIFTLTVTDDSGATASAQVTVTVNKPNNDTSGTTPVTPPANLPPVANAGSNQTITLPVDSVILDGSASNDSDGKIVSWKWVKTSGPASFNIKNSSGAKTAVSGLANGTYIFTLTVTDDSGATASAQVTVTANKPNNDTTGTTPVTPPANLPPVANAGSNQNIFLPDNATTLDGSSSYDPDGKIVSWKWSQQSGPASATILQAGNAKTSVNNLVNGVYVFTLIVTDNRGATDTSNITIGVYKRPDQPPVANAGQDITIVAPKSTATLDGSASNDPDGTVVKYQWEPMTGPTQAKLLTPDAPTTIASGLQVGTYDFKLTVTDNDGISSTATVSVYVMPARDTTPTTFRIYPNPVHDELHVELDKAITGLLEFRIIDVNGRILKVYRFGQLPMHVTKVLDVSGLAPGIYFIQLIEDNQLRDVRKMIKY